MGICSTRNEVVGEGGGPGNIYPGTLAPVQLPSVRKAPPRLHDLVRDDPDGDEDLLGSLLHTDRAGHADVSQCGYAYGWGAYAGLGVCRDTAQCMIDHSIAGLYNLFVPDQGSARAEAS